MGDVDSDHFSLRWNKFHENLSYGFHALLQEENLVDVTLAAGGQFAQAHKIVLSVCSPYFKELFRVNPCKHPIVILKDVQHKDLIAILQFMYCGEVNVRQENLSAFLKTAEMLQIKGLTGDEESSEFPSLPEVQPAAPPRVRKVPEKKPVMQTPQFTRTPVEEKPEPVKVPSPVDFAPVEPRGLMPLVEFTQKDIPARNAKRQRLDPSVSVTVTPSTSAPAPTTADPSPDPSLEADVEFVEMGQPKDEPIELDSEDEGSDSILHASDETFARLFAGEGSLSQHDGKVQASLIQPYSGESSLSQHDLKDGTGVQLTSELPTLPNMLQNPAQDIQYYMKGKVQCHFCNAFYSTTGNLRIHIKDKHLGSERNTCPVCNAKFMNKSSLRTHTKKIHNLRLSDILEVSESTGDRLPLPWHVEPSKMLS